MRLISYKHQMKACKFKKAMALVRSILIGTNLFKWRFEIVKTKKTISLRFYILRSKLSNTEEKWINSKLMGYINDEIQN